MRLLREHLGRIVPQMETDAEARIAAEEIVSELGRRLGFTTRRDAGEDVDVWSSPTGRALVVRPSAAGETIELIRTLSRARDRLLVQRGMPARNLMALAVVCGSLVNWREIEESSVVRRSHDHVRIIALDALLSLAEARASSSLAHTDALMLLRPQSVRADALVEIVARVSRRDPERGRPGVDSGMDPFRRRSGLPGAAPRQG
ncbi:MAG TPA: hypothetical protein VNK41_04770 [Vicinamibacterales bacterium]|nr:hypothetical protein [Vicinamibacterales bacterium]